MPHSLRASLFTVLLLASCASSPAAPAAEPAPPSAAVQVVPLRYAAAHELANVLSQLLMEPGITGRVVADARTNSVVVEAPAEDLPRILELIAQLDVEKK